MYQKIPQLSGDQLTTSRVLSIRHFAASATINIAQRDGISRRRLDFFIRTTDARITFSIEKNFTIDIFYWLLSFVVSRPTGHKYMSNMQVYLNSNQF